MANGPVNERFSKEINLSLKILGLYSLSITSKHITERGGLLL